MQCQEGGCGTFELSQAPLACNAVTNTLQLRWVFFFVSRAGRCTPAAHAGCSSTQSINLECCQPRGGRCTSSNAPPSFPYTPARPTARLHESSLRRWGLGLLVVVGLFFPWAWFYSECAARGHGWLERCCRPSRLAGPCRQDASVARWHCQAAACAASLHSRTAPPHQLPPCCAAGQIRAVGRLCGVAAWGVQALDYGSLASLAFEANGTVVRASGAAAALQPAPLGHWLCRTGGGWAVQLLFVTILGMAAIIAAMELVHAALEHLVEVGGRGGAGGLAGQGAVAASAAQRAWLWAGPPAWHLKLPGVACVAAAALLIVHI